MIRPHQVSPCGTSDCHDTFGSEPIDHQGLAHGNLATGVADDHRRRRVVGSLSELVSGEGGIDRNRYEAGTQSAVVRHHKLNAVARDEGHAVSPPYATR